MNGDPEDTIRGLLTRILDTAEKSEDRIMAAIEKQRQEFKDEISPLYDRVRVLEIEFGKSYERNQAVAGRVGGLVALLTSGVLLVSSWLFNHWPGSGP